MAVKAGAVLRAVLESHARVVANRLRREMGRRGAVVMSAVTVIFGLFVAAPMIVWGALGGYGAGLYLERSLVRAGLGVGLFAVSVGGGILSGTTGGGRQLQWESYRAFPLRHRLLFAAELLASLIDPIPLLLSGVILAGLVGVGVAQPGAWPLLVPLGLASVALLMLTQTIFASFAAAVLRWIRVAFGFLVCAAVLGALLLASQGPGKGKRALSAEALVVLQGRFEAAAAWLPSTWGVESVHHGLSGRLVEAAALQTAVAVGVALVALLALWLTAREADGDGIAPAFASAGLWSFRTPTLGVARLTWQALVDSAIGRFGLVVPFITLLLVRWPLAQYTGRGGFAVPAAYAYVALSNTSIQFNQFGLDGHGIKALLLLPIRTEAIFQGKALGIGFYCAVQIVLLALLFGVTQRTGPNEAAAGALLGASLAVIYNAAGRWTSSWLPRSLARRRMRSVSAPAPFVVFTLALTLGNGLLLGGVYVACARHAPALLVPAMGAIFVLAWIAHQKTLGSAVRYFERRREKVLEALS